MANLGGEELRAHGRHELAPRVAGRVADPMVDERHPHAAAGEARDAEEESGGRKAERRQEDASDDPVSDCAQ
jgi:hypothetical protein